MSRKFNGMDFFALEKCESHCLFPWPSFPRGTNPISLAALDSLDDGDDDGSVEAL